MSITVTGKKGVIHIFLLSQIRLIVVLGGLILIYALVGFFLVPHLLNKYATGYVRDEMHRQLHLGDVRFNPFTLTLQLAQVEFLEANGGPIAAVENVLVDAELASLFTGIYTFKSIHLVGPTVQVVVDAQGHVNLAFNDLKKDHQAERADDSLPKLRIGEFALINGRVHIEDLARPVPFSTDLTPIQFKLDDFRSEPAYGNAFHFSARSHLDEILDFKGKLTLQPFASSGNFKIADLTSGTLQSYLHDVLPFRLLAGRVNVEGDYDLSLAQDLNLKLSLPHVVLTGFGIAPKVSDGTPWVSWVKLGITDTQVSLNDRNIAIKKISLEQPNFKAVLDQRRNLNLLELMGPDEANDHPWVTRVEQIRMDKAVINLEDRGVNPSVNFVLSPAQLMISDFSTAPDATIGLNTSFVINDRTEFSALGSVNLDTLTSDLKIKLSQFSLPTIQHYVAESADVIISSGLLAAEGQVYYKGSARVKSPDLKFLGDVQITNFATQDRAERKDFIKWQSLQLKDIHYSMAPDVLDIGQITARKPFGRVIINHDGMTNIQTVLRLEAGSSNEVHADGSISVSEATLDNSVKSSSLPTMRTHIGGVKIEEGSVNFTDNSVQPYFVTGIQKLAGTITGVSSENNSRAKVNFRGSVDNYAPVSIAGEVNFLAADAYSDIAMNFNNMELTTFNPYSGKFAGYSISKGKLSTDIRYQVRNRQLDATHHIVLDQLQFGAATDSKDAVPLPIRLAVSLLKDRKGVIDLNLPVKGSIDDPKFRVGPIVWKMVVNLMTRIVTAPFTALGSLFGRGEELAFVDFAPGSALLSSAEADKLINLGKALVERPQLKLNIPLTVINDIDATVLNQQAFDRSLEVYLPDSTVATSNQRLLALVKMYQVNLGVQPTFPVSTAVGDDVTKQRIAYLEELLKPHFTTSAASRDELTRQRAYVVQSALLANSELAAERVYLTARHNDAKSPDNQVRMLLVLE